MLGDNLLDRVPDLVKRGRVLRNNLELLEELLLAAVQIINALVQVIHALRGHNDLVLQNYHALLNLAPRLQIRVRNCPLERAD